MLIPDYKRVNKKGNKSTYAFSNFSISNFFICINTGIVFLDFSGSLINPGKMEGTISDAEDHFSAFSGLN
jgi:hypothetical protein